MPTTSPQFYLNALQTTFESLQEIGLTANAQEAIAEALRSLAALREVLAESEEQGRLAALYRVSQALGTSLKTDQVLNQVMDAVIELTGAERGFLMLVDPETGELDLQAARNFERENLQREDMEVSLTVIRSSIESGQGIVTTNAKEDPRFEKQDSVIMFNLQSILCAPLKSRGRTIGVIYVENRGQKGRFSKADLELLDAFAAQAAVAIENAHLYTRTDHSLAARVEELEILSQIDRELNARLALDHVVEITLSWAKKGTGAEEGWIALSGEGISSLGVVSGAPEESAFREDDPLVLRTMAEAVPHETPPGAEPVRLIFPITLSGQPIGVISLAKKAPFSEADRQFLLRLAHRAATAIDNARLHEAVQFANQAKSKFISVVSHELRIPMTSIKGYTDLMLKETVGPINDQQTNFLGVIRKNVERMASLVADLSDISRIETGRLRLDLQPVALKACVAEVLQNLRQKIDEKTQVLQVSIPENLPPAYADPNRVIQVLTNLVSNAWKYTLEGGQISVTVREMSPGFLRVEVADQGIGISPEDQARMFSQFFRSEHPVVREQQGWGLGLHVTKNLVELMGGEIGMHSRLGEGTTFWFTLPATSPAQA